MKNQLTYIVAALLFGALVFYAASHYVAKKQTEVRQALTEAVDHQMVVLQEVAALTNGNGSNDVVKQYVRDCNAQLRTEFDTTLNTLGTLTSTELKATDALFAACASFFANQKTAMVAQLESEYKTLKGLTDILGVIDSRTSVLLLEEDWELFISMERQRADLLRERVSLQREIIDALKEGAAPQDSSIREKMTKAQEVTETGTVLGKQIDVVYARISDV